MKTLICTNCLKTVSVADAAPGTDVNCPECGKSFSIPAGYTPAVTPNPVPPPPPPPLPPPAALPPVVSPPRPATPPGYIPPAPPPPVVVPPPTLSAGYTRARGFVVNPKTVAWLPAVCLTLVVFMSLVCPWVGSYPAGHAVNSQGLWGASFGRVNRNVKLEEMMKSVKGGWQDLVKSNWELLIPALLALVVATVAAWADRRLTTLDAKKLPVALKWTASLWSRRQFLIGTLTAFALALITIQTINGFGMEKAIKKSVADRFADERKAAGASESAQATVDFKVEQEVMNYSVEYTMWAYLSFVLLALAALAVVARWGLDRRGNKPPPRFLIEY